MVMSGGDPWDMIRKGSLIKLNVWQGQEVKVVVEAHSLGDFLSIWKERNRRAFKDIEGDVIRLKS